jgi:hypothetical protein
MMAVIKAKKACLQQVIFISRTAFESKLSTG